MTQKQKDSGKGEDRARRNAAMTRKPTMNDVARLAGVGAMTVSRYLSGAVRVAEETAQRVQAAIDELGYRPNELARAFRGQRSHSIGLILPYIYDPFFATCAHAVTTVARERGYSVLLTTSNGDVETEYSEIEHMLERHVDGLLAIPAHHRNSRLNRTLMGRTPAVVFDRPVADTSIDTVTVHNSTGARRMVEHMIEHGHKRIAFLGLGRDLYTINARYEGYRKALREAGLEEDAILGCTTEAATLTELETRLRGPHAPTALLSSNTLVSRFVLGALVTMGVKVPTDVALAAFDDFDMAECAAPPLTVVRQPAAEMGRVAANLLFDRIARDESPQTGNRIVLPVELVLRRSCGCRHRTPLIVH